MNGGTRRRQRFVGPLGLLALVSGVGIALYLALPEKQALVAGSQVQPDAVSLSYLELLLRQAPSDGSLRLRLANAQHRAGQLEAARKTLGPLLETDTPERARARALAFDLDVSLVRALPPEAPARETARQSALEELMRRATEASSSQDLATLGRLALELEGPERAARLLTRAALCAPDLPLSSLPDDFALGASRPDELGRALALEALTYAAWGRSPNVALEVGDALLERFPYDVALLERAARDALERGDHRRARTLGEAWAGLRPNSAGPLSWLLDVALASNDPGGAFEVAERMRALGLIDAKRERRLAQLAEWAGRPRQALERWRSLAAKGDLEASAKALGLARGLDDQRSVAALLLERARFARLLAGEVMDLAYSLEVTAGPAAAAEALRRHCRRHPCERAAWEKSARLFEVAGQPDAAVESWADLGARFGDPVGSAREEARVLLGPGRVAEALERLRTVAPMAAEDDRAFWELFAELAWRRNDPASSEAYRVLRRRGDLGSIGLERLLLLAQAAGDLDETTSVAEEGWSRLRNERLLLMAAEDAARQGRWEVLEKLLGMPATGEPLLARSERFWLLSAALEKHRGRRAAARAAYERALAASPRSAEAQAGLLWLAIDGRATRELAALLPRFEAHARHEPALWGAFVAGRLLLGQPSEALPWFERMSEQTPDDPLLLARWAETLEEAGRHAQAEKVAARALGRLPSPEAAKNLGDAELTSLTVLVARREGERSAQPWMEALRARGKDASARERLAFLALSAEDLDAARRWAPEPERRSPALRLAMALAGEDEDELEAIARAGPSVYGFAGTAEAEGRLGRRVRALTLARQGLAEATTEAELDRLSEQHRRFEETSGARAALAASQRSLSGLDLRELAASGRVALGEALVEPMARIARVMGPGAETAYEGGLSLSGRFGPVRAWAGATLDGSRALPALGLELSGAPSRRVEGRVSGVVGELADESGPMRLNGVRDAVAASGQLTLGPRDFLRASAGARRYRDRDGAGAGEAVFADVGFDHRLRLRGPELTAGWRALGFSAFPDREGRPSGLALPDDFFSTGLALTARGEVGALTWEAEGFGGWTLPRSRPAFRLSLGTAHEFSGGRVLSAGGHLSSDGFFDGVESGLRLSFIQRLGL